MVEDWHPRAANLRYSEELLPALERKIFRYSKEAKSVAFD
jgi:hypothetical protein